MNKILTCGLASILSLSLIGCKEYRTEYSEIKHENAVVSNQYHRNSYMYPLRVGKITTIQTMPAVYRTDFDGNIDFSVHGSKIYNSVSEGDSVDLTYREVYRAVYDDKDNDDKKELISRKFKKYELVTITLK